jgi:hypothetical protein
MKYLRASLVSMVVSVAALTANGTKQSLRAELAKQERSQGYSLVDVWGSRDGHINVVSPDSRTSSKATVKDIQKLTSEQCDMPGEHYSLFRKEGIWLRDKESDETGPIDSLGQYSHQCFSPARKIVYTAGKMIRIYDLSLKRVTNIGEGSSPAWSPDGTWLGFDDGRHYVLLNVQTGTRRKLFGTKYGAGVYWSPDSRYLTYTKPGGSTGGFLFWGIKCIEPYRVWVWRAEDGAHDWVDEICKLGRSFLWIANSELSPEKP